VKVVNFLSGLINKELSEVPMNMANNLLLGIMQFRAGSQEFEQFMSIGSVDRHLIE